MFSQPPTQHVQVPQQPEKDRCGEGNQGIVDPMTGRPFSMQPGARCDPDNGQRPGDGDPGQTRDDGHGVLMVDVAIRQGQQDAEQPTQ